MTSAEIIAIGSELLTPLKTDTNSQWLTAKLDEIGVEVKLKTIVGDDEPRLEEAIRDSLKRSDVVITTGGLGPTEDDITRQAAARALNRELVFREEIVADLRQRFRRWGREMPEINKRQAYVIEGADVLPNPNGSAPGMLLEIDGKVLALLPGPPREMQPMFESYVFPKLRSKSDGVVVSRRVLKVTGMGESAVDEMIAPIYNAYDSVQTSILFNQSEVEIHLASRAKTGIEAETPLNELTNEIAEKMGDALFTTSGETMEEVVAKLLTEHNKTLSAAESCTGGLIAKRLTELPGSSKYFMEGIVAYSDYAKFNTLNIPAEVLEKYGAVSAETAEAMAVGMRDRAQTDLAISVTGIAGPDGGSEGKPVGLVFLGLAFSDGVRSMRLMLIGDRYLIRWRSSQAVLDYLRRYLLKKNYDE